MSDPADLLNDWHLELAIARVSPRLHASGNLICGRRRAGDHADLGNAPIGGQLSFSTPGLGKPASRHSA